MLACALLALALAAIAAPAYAGAQAANEEYRLQVPGSGAHATSGGGGQGGGSSSSSSGGGTPIALIGLAAIAAACAGVAVWRLRGRDEPRPTKVPTGAPNPTGESQ